MNIDQYIRNLNELRAVAQAIRPSVLYLVGGAVRDALSGVINDDYDVAAAIDCEEAEKLFSEHDISYKLVNKRTHTLKLCNNGVNFEFTSFRYDSDYRGHTPQVVERTADIALDAKRRDFRCNAIYYDVLGGVILDPLGGLTDVKNRVLICTRAPEDVISEDPLRLLRAVRQSAQTGFSIDMSVRTAIKNNAYSLDDISGERIREELCKIIKVGIKQDECGDKDQNLSDEDTAVRLSRALDDLDELGLSEVIFGRTIASGDIKLKINSKNYETRLMCIVRRLYRNGANIANIMERLKVSSETQNFLCSGLNIVTKLINCADSVANKGVGDGADEKKRIVLIECAESVSQAIRCVKKTELFIDAVCATLENNGRSNLADKLRDCYNHTRAIGLTGLKSLSVTGNDLCALGFTGSAIGRTMQNLFLAVIRNDVENDKTQLLLLAKKLNS